MTPKNNIRFQVRFILLLSLVILTHCSKDEESLTISTISPESGPIGTAVVITGKGFGASPADNVVKFNGIEAAIIDASTAQIIAQVPTTASTGQVSIQVGSNTAMGPVFTITGPQVTKKYYIKFKAAGSLKIFEDGNPGFQTCGQCACSAVPVFGDRYATLDICVPDDQTIGASDIESWNNTTIPVNAPDIFPVAHFGYEEGGSSYHTDDATDQTGSKVTITKVENDGALYDKKAYKVTGIFQCKLAKSDGSSATSITEGEFVIRYTEDF